MKLKFKLKDKNNKKSIKGQLTFIIVSMVVICCILLGITTSFLNYKTANNVLSKTIMETTHQASENVSAKIRGIQNAAIQTGCMKEISDPKATIEEKKNIIENQVKLYGFERGNILDANGVSYFDNNDYSDRDYFKESISGKEYISEPTISKVTSKTTFVVSAPIWENGVSGSKIVGVVYFVPNENFLNEIVENITVSANSYAYLINNKGTTIADEDYSLVGQENVIELSKTNSKFIPYAEADKKLISGETGNSHFNAEGKNWVLGYTPVKHTNGWGLGIMVQKNDFFGELYASIGATITLGIVFILAAFIIGRRFANIIGNPLKECSERLEKLAEGDLQSDIPNANINYEIGLVSDATNKIVTDLRNMITTLIYLLTEISNGNLDIDINNNETEFLFAKDFNPMLVASNKIIQSLNDTLSQIHMAGEQVAIGSDQVSEGAQVLSQGATEQASSVQELSATINEVSQHINKTAQNAARAKEISIKSSSATSLGKAKMEEMIVAMNEISQTSNEIGNIIKNIDDIAFQTNILALNAAVEAARAGSAGKGFAVVADEVRNLAAKSAESAKNTAELIEKALIAIENGTQIVSETAKSLDDVVEGAQQSAEVIQKIADASSEQAEHISQVNVGVEQISVVVQTNSATAEESAAASEELSSQAQMLKDLISKFKLKDVNNYYEDENFFGNQ
ncbi:methyl-accepting chemotaxis protein [Romboutsia lituseburensis]|nr:methyl-accepting chemotaxis protein [Romboutsia lituseburensis]